MFRKDYTTAIGKFLPSNPFLEDSFIKFGTDIEVCAFVDSIPEVGQNSIKNFLIHGLSDAKHLFLMQLRKIILLTPAKLTLKSDPKTTPSLKESDFDK